MSQAGLHYTGPFDTNACLYHTPNVALANSLSQDLEVSLSAKIFILLENI